MPELTVPFVGQRVISIDDIEKFDSGILPTNSIGTVAYIEDDCIAVKLDEHFDWLDSWNNEIHLYADEAIDMDCDNMTQLFNIYFKEVTQ